MWCPNCQGYVRNKPGIHSEQVYVQLSYHEVSEKGQMTFKYRCPSCKCEFVIIEEGEQGQRLTLIGRQEESEKTGSSRNAFRAATPSQGRSGDAFAAAPLPHDSQTEKDDDGVVWKEKTLTILVLYAVEPRERQPSIFWEALEELGMIEELGGKN